MRLYFDHQATTPLLPGAAAAMSAHLIEKQGNPHSVDHAFGWDAADALEDARRQVSSRLGCTQDGLFFTSGATEANNIAMMGCLAGRGGRNRMVVSALEHRSVLGPASFARRAGLELVVVQCDHDGVVDAEAFCAALDDRTLIAALMLVNNEVGTVQPVERIGERCRALGILFHVDAVQALRWLPIDVEQLGCSMLSVSAHKVGGPMGIGALYVDPAEMHRLAPLMHGGEQESGLRPGTVPAFLAAGFAAALDELPDRLSVEEWRSRTGGLLDRLRRSIPSVSLNGRDRDRHPGNLNIELPGIDAGLVIATLQPHVALSQGSACTSGSTEPSHVLAAMGMDARRSASSLRISTAPNTSVAEIEELSDRFVEAVRWASRAA